MNTDQTQPTVDDDSVDAAFQAFYDGADPETLDVTQRMNDELTAELRGDDPPAASHDDSPSGDDSQEASDSGVDPENELLTKLKRATRDKAVADERLHETRSKAEMLEAENAELRRLLRMPQEQPAQPAQASAPSPAPVSDQELDAFMADFDPDWKTNREDPEARRAARYAISLTRAAVKHVAGQFGPVAQSLEQLRFDGRLSRLGISREEFDAIWSRPGREYGQKLSDEEKLMALTAEAARMPARGPSPNAPSAQRGAPPASKVDPRRTVELDQGGSAPQAHPQTLSAMKLEKALQSGDVAQMEAAADPLFEALYNGWA